VAHWSTYVTGATETGMQKLGEHFQYPIKQKRMHVALVADTIYIVYFA